MRLCQAILAFLLLLSPAAQAQDSWESHSACLDQAVVDPEIAYEDAKIWERNGGGVLARHCWAVAAIGMGEYEEAAVTLEALAALGNDAAPLEPASLYAQAAQAWILAGSLDDAAIALDTSLSLRADDVETMIDRANVAALQGDYWRAVDELNWAEDLAPDRADVYLLRGTAYRFLESYDLALVDLDRAIELDGSNPSAFLERGNIKRLLEDKDGARADWLKVLSLEEEGQDADAARANLEALDVNPDGG